MKQRFTFLFTFLLTVTFLSNNIMAQGVTSAAMNGTVTDKDGKPLNGATVQLVHEPTGTKFGNTTRDDGRYNIQNLRVGGPYTVKVSYVGFTPQTKENMFFELGQSFRLDFILYEKTVELNALTITGDRSGILNSSRTGAATTVSKTTIENFPTIARTFQSFQKFNPQSSGRSNSTAGRNEKFNNIQIDGAQYNDLFGLGSYGTPGGQAGTNPIAMDAIQEFQVVVSPYDVRMGGFTGGGINAITRAGTNNLTGSAYYYTRNEDFVGKSPDTLKTKLTEFSEYQAGFRIGGPIMKDNLFFFVSGEATKRKDPKPNLALTQGPGLKNNIDSLARKVQSILTDKYGYNPGGYAPLTVERPSLKLFLRFDYNINQDHQLTLRHNFVDASDQIYSPTTASFFYQDRMYKFLSTTNSTVLQLNSRFGNNMSNELILGYTRTRDKREIGGNPFPSLTVNTSISGFNFRAGSEEFSIANQLDQDVFEITDNFSYFMGNHVLTVGTHNEIFSFRNLFIRDMYGNYTFVNPDSLAKGAVDRFTYSYVLPGGKESAKFGAVQLGFYAQDEWTIIPTLKLTFGLKVDIPIFPDKPTYNDSVAYYFGSMGLSTDKVPSGKLLLSPRLGFNWDVFGDRTSQVRGGVGMFSGKVPYVWISNQYGNTGRDIGRIDLRASALPAGFKFNPNALNQTTQGMSAVKTSEVDLTDSDFKMTQVLRFNVGFDQQLPFGLTGTVDFLYTKSINDILYQDINLAPSTGVWEDGRPVYAKRISSASFTNVILMKNTNKGYQYNISGQVQGDLPYGFNINTGYAYGKATDLNSVVSSQAFSQWRYNPVQGDPNNPVEATSNFELKHRVFVGLTYNYEFVADWKTSVSIFYNGQSGRPFSYTYDGDVNGDGQITNDLIYVPRDKSEIRLGTINSSTKAYVAATQAQYDALFNYINRDEYMSKYKGQIIERNGGYEPWSDQLDLRISQEIPNPFAKGHNLQISLDILNVINLIDGDKGWIEYVVNQNDSVIKYLGKAADGKAVYSFTDKANPFQKDNLSSRWQMQLGIRYTL